MMRGNRGGMGMGMGMQNTRNNISSGPLMTDHYSGLQDIDKELELLKRKREIIEKQQQIMAMRNDMPSYSNQSSEIRFNNYSQLYEEVPSTGGLGGRKRPTPVWENEMPSKRVAGQSSSNYGAMNSFNSQYNPPSRGSNAQPYKNYQQRNHTSQKSGPVQKKKDFYPNKVAKKSPGGSFNKLNTYPQAERKKLVSAADNTVAKPTGRPQPLGDMILREDCVPTRQMAGRLELGLGAIIKELKTKFPEDAVKHCRPLKQLIRERLRTVMMGKSVGVIDNIKKNYRAHFPEDTDEDLMLRAVEASNGTDFILSEAGDPKDYFFKNMGRLMHTRLDEMFDRLLVLYRQDNPQSNLAADTQNKDNQNEKPTDKNKDNQNEKPTDKNKDNQNEKPTDEKKVKTTAKEEAFNELSQKLLSNEKYQQLDKLMNVKLAKMLRKCCPAIVKILNMDAMYRKTVARIEAEVKRKITKEGPNEPQSSQKEQTIHRDLEDTKKNNRPYAPLPYHVKVMGRPSLPKRNAMETFFEDYRPAMIKKHRNVHNILFVGFKKKEDYERILKADGTVIGRFTLTIKVSERKDNNNASSPSIKVEEAGKTDDTPVLNPELDEQITDLLSSIRRSEEEEKEKESQQNEMKENTQQNEETNDNEVMTIDNNEITETHVTNTQSTETPEKDISTVDVDQITDDNTGDENKTTENKDKETIDSDSDCVEIKGDEPSIIVLDNTIADEEQSVENVVETAQENVKIAEHVEDLDAPKTSNSEEKPCGTSTPVRTSARLASKHLN